jgi:hypothetical protein
MALPVPPTTRPMEAEPVDELPRGAGWLYELNMTASAA